MQPLFRIKELAFLVLPLLGIVSIFWWSFLRGIPEPLKPLISTTDAASLVSGLLIHAVAAAFFSRIAKVFFHYTLTRLRDYLPSANRKNGRSAWSLWMYRINRVRRFLRTRGFIVEAVLGVFLFSLYVFGRVNWGLLLGTVWFSYMSFVGLYGVFFRVQKQSAFLLPPVPSNVSPDRTFKFKVSWAVTSLILMSFILGTQLRVHRETNLACLRISGVYVTASVLLHTGDAIIVAQPLEDEGLTYSALPLSALERLDVDRSDCVAR